MNSSATAASHDEPLRGNARLPGVEESAFGAQRRDLGQVGVGEYDEGVGSAELEHRFLDLAAGDRADRATGAFTAGDGHRTDPRIGDQAFGGGGHIGFGDQQGGEQPVG